MVMSLNVIYCGLCILQSVDVADHGPEVSRGKEGAVPD